MTEQKPTAEALKVARQICSLYRGGGEFTDIEEAIATLVTAKDAEIERLKVAVHEKNVAAECFERERDFAWDERNKLREQNQQRALLVELATQLKRGKRFLARCSCAGSDGWREICDIVKKSQKVLSTPAVVELLKEGK